MDNLITESPIKGAAIKNVTERLFVPFSEELMAANGLPPGELVPYQRSYRCVRLLDGTYEFEMSHEAAPALPTRESIVQAA